MKTDGINFYITSFTQKLQDKGNEIYYNTYLKTVEFAEKIKQKGEKIYFAGGSTRNIINNFIKKSIFSNT